MLKRLKVMPQYLLPQRALTRFAGWCGACRWGWLKNCLIRYFIRRYKVDLNAALSADLSEYPNFNSFFTRALKPELRPIIQDPQAIASPVDGIISQIGHIDDGVVLQAKGFDYNLLNLLGGLHKRALQFQNGSFATIYLSPKDYHRVHMPLTGYLRETVYIPGKLFSVNPNTAETVSELFSRNERLVCFFDTKIGPMAVILVGAMLVGSIHTVWGDPMPSKPFANLTYSKAEDNGIRLQRGAELGHFQMGSTVILLFPENKVKMPDLKTGDRVQMGQFFGETL